MRSRVQVHHVLVVILGLGLVFRLVHFAALARTSFPDIPVVATQSDMHATWQWAHTILDGDLLGRRTYHPYFDWMREIAPIETWYQWWGGREVFQQAPLYAYWMAAVLWVSGHSLRFVLLVQLLVGAAHPLVMFALGRRLFGTPAGLLAAALTAVYAPFIFYQGTHLRDWMIPVLEPLAVLLLLQAEARGRRRDGVLAGGSLGATLLARESSVLLLAMALPWMLARTARSGWLKAGWVLVGVLLVLTPLVVRNVVVGAPVLSLSNRGPEVFIAGNAADATPTLFTVPSSLPGILQRSDGRPLRVVQETLATYAGSGWALLGHEATKVRGLADPVEIPSNESFSYGLELSPVLRLLLRYGAVLPLGLAGLILLAAQWRAHLLLLLYAAATLAALLLSLPLGRFRLALVPILLLYSGAALVWLRDALRARRARHLAAGLGLVAALAVFQQLIVPIPALRDSLFVALHPSSYFNAARAYLKAGEPERGVAQIERLRARILADPRLAPQVAEAALLEGDLRVLWARTLAEEHRLAAARTQIDLAARAYAPHADLARTHLNLGALRVLVGDEAGARAAFTSFLRLEPTGPRADQVRAYLSSSHPPAADHQRAVLDRERGGARPRAGLSGR